jgi:hypothetical protein
MLEANRAIRSPQSSEVSRDHRQQSTESAYADERAADRPVARRGASPHGQRAGTGSKTDENTQVSASQGRAFLNRVPPVRRSLTVESCPIVGRSRRHSNRGRWLARTEAVGRLLTRMLTTGLDCAGQVRTCQR